jgi:hypothetical protein
MHSFCIYIIQIRTILLTRKEVIINLWLNRDDNNYVLICIVAIYVELGDGRTLSTRFFCYHSKISKLLICSRTVAALWLSRKSESKTIWTHQLIRRLMQIAKTWWSPVKPIKPFRPTFASINFPILFIFSRLQSSMTYLSKTNELLQISFITMLEPLKRSYINFIIIFCVIPFCSTIY